MSFTCTVRCLAPQLKKSNQASMQPFDFLQSRLLEQGLSIFFLSEVSKRALQGAQSSRLEHFFTRAGPHVSQPNSACGVCAEGGRSKGTLSCPIPLGEGYWGGGRG